MKTLQEVAAAPTAELVAFYNKRTGKNIKKFSDRNTAIAKVSALLPTARPTPAPKRQPSGSTISEAVKRTWTDPNVAAARRLRHGCRVGGQNYKSVRDAFKALNLPDSKHIAFRLELKAKGRATFENYTFTLVPREDDAGAKEKGAKE